MFKPCPNCGFLVALLPGREASQRCPRCGSALVGDADVAESAAQAPNGARPASARAGERPGSHDVHEAQRIDATRIGDAAAADGDRVPRSRVDDSASASAADAASMSDGIVPTSDAAVAGADDDGSGASSDPALAPPRATVDGPSFARRRERAMPGGRRWPWAVALAALALLLALQLLLSQRVELARDARWRPVVLQACNLLGCDVPAWHAPGDYAMVARGVRPDPRRPGVLRVTATVRNDARWAQPAPTVVLSLSDVDGRLVGARAVPPPLYGRRAGLLVAPGDSLDIAFDVREPAGHVESFDFQLQ